MRTKAAGESVAFMMNTEERYRHSARVFSMLRELHVLGYEQLRVVPGMSPSGMHYRVLITVARNTRRNNGALAASANLIAPHSSADGANLFGWADAPGADTGTLAGYFIERFAHIARGGAAPDSNYVAWFRDEVLVAAKHGAFPIAYADYDVSADGFLRTTRSEISIPMPPAGSFDPTDRPESAG